MIKYKFLIIFMLIASMAIAQNFDQAKMNRDLEVANTVLNSLLNKGNMGWNQDKNKGKYIPGYGVILTMPEHTFIFGNIAVAGEDFVVDINDEDVAVEVATGFADTEALKELENQLIEAEKNKDLSDEQRRELEERLEERIERTREIEERRQEIVFRAQSIANNAVKTLKLDSIQMKNEAKRLEIMKSFLVDYAHLIGQLQDDEKILIADKSAHMVGWTNSLGVDALKQNKLSAEITMGDVKAFQSGKISREEALSRIKVNEKSSSNKVYKDLELFKSIISRLYSEDLAETYYAYGSIEYEKIDDLGAMFFMKTVSSIKDMAGLWKMPTQSKQGLNQKDRDDLVKSLYPKFEDQLKDNIVEYGRTINSLKAGEQLIFNAQITKCEGCGIPQNLELRIKSEYLADYNAGKLTQKQVIDKIEVNRGENQ